MSYTLAYKGAEIDDILGRAAPGGALDTAIAAKQDALTFDDTPESGSDNPVKSGGIYDAIQAGGATALAAFATDSVSGDVVSFPDGADSIPVKAFTGSIIPQQNLNGQSAPYPAGGGANKWDEQWEVGGISQETGQNSSASNTIRAKNICACSPSTTYYLGTNVAAIYWYGTGGSYISFDYNNASGNVRTSPSTATGFRILMKSGYGTTYHNDIAVNYPSTVTTYSPYENICPISGWTGANITDAGGIDSDIEQGGIDSSGFNNNAGNRMRTASYYAVDDTKKYTFNITKIVADVALQIAVSFYTTNDYTTARTSGTGWESVPYTFTPPSGTKYIRVCIRKANNAEVNPSQTHNAMFGKTIVLSFGETVYAGTLTALGGGLWQVQPTHVAVDMGSAEWTYDATYTRFKTTVSAANYGNRLMPIYCSIYQCIDDGRALANVPDYSIYNGSSTSIYIKDTRYTDPAAIALALSGQYMVYPLGTLPDPITITGEDLQTLLGANTVWLDCGSVTGMTYRADTALYIQKLLNGGGTLQTLSMASPSPSLSLGRVGVLAEPEADAEPEEVTEEAEADTEEATEE